jgi:aspartate-semialdehyde dehydrogenase
MCRRLPAVSDERVSSAVLGAGGYIGQQFVRLLADHPRFRLEELATGGRSAGRTLAEIWRLEEPPPDGWGRVPLHRRSPRYLAGAGVRVAFSGLPSGRAASTELELHRRGIAVFSNAADLREDPRSQLLLPEVNGAATLRRPNRAPPLITNPNCTATGLALALAPVLSALRARRVHVSTYQALSGAGVEGLEQLSRPPNVVPFIPQEEEKVSRETVRLLGAGARRLEVLASCARVPVREGHLESVTVETGRECTRPELERGWRNFNPLQQPRCPSAPHPPILIRSEQDRPQPLLDLWAGTPRRARGMAVTVGRLRVSARHVRFFLLVHNAVRGGAGGSVLNAEYADARGWLERGS